MDRAIIGVGHLLGKHVYLKNRIGIDRLRKDNYTERSARLGLSQTSSLGIHASFQGTVRPT